MTIFKHIKTGKLYLIYTLSKDGDQRIPTALPYLNDGEVIHGAKLKDFIPISVDTKLPGKDGQVI